MRLTLVALSLGMIVTTACEDSKKSQSGEKPGAVAGKDAAKDQDPNAGPAGTKDPNDGFFTGFDGTTDYSILVPRFRTMTIKDASVAKIEEIKVKLPETTLQKIIEARKAEDPNFDAERFKRFLGRDQTVYKITPLKAGRTTIQTSGGRGGGPGRGQNGWGKSKEIDLVVTAYTSEQFAVGKARYETEGGGKLKACKSCHETGEKGAPPHELGRIMEVNEADTISWLKTGRTKGRTAKIDHAWEFSSVAEEKGVVAYLRSKQTNDVETLIKLRLEEWKANGD